MFGAQIEAAFASESGGEIMGYVLLFLYYFINYFVIVFFNAALIHCAVKVMNGEETNISDGLSFAASRLLQIMTWAALAATVGVILKTLQERAGWIGKIILGLIGGVWSIATFFVVPVLIYEKQDVFTTVKRSAEIMRDTWGESLTANFGFGLMYFALIFSAVPLGILLFNIAPVALGIVTIIAYILMGFTVLSAAKTVFIAAAYQHATGRPTGEFRSDLLDDAFMVKS